MSSNNVQDKLAVITGGSSGIGFSTAQSLLAAGAKVALIGRSLDKLKAAKKELGQKFDEGRVYIVQGDVCNDDHLERLFSEIHDKAGKINILANCAGVERHTELLSLDRDLFRHVFSTNVEGPFFTLQKAIPYLDSHATIIFISSVLADMVRPNGPFVYAASKAAVNRMALYLANEEIIMKNNHTVTVVAPGPTYTPLLDDIDDAILDTVKAALPRQDFSTSEEIAEVIMSIVRNPHVYNASIVDCSSGVRNLPLRG